MSKYVIDVNDPMGEDSLHVFKIKSEFVRERIDMKVVAFNGSPNKEGNTWHALKMVTDELERESKTYMNFIH